MAEAKEKRVRKPRRNFEKELAALKLYCEVSIEVLERPEDALTPVGKGEVSALRRVLAKINGGQS